MLRPTDNNKIIQFLAALNHGRAAENPLWIEITGLKILPRLEVDDIGKITVTPTAGFPVKAFLNKETGEVKMFTARRFGRSEQ